jgi:ATP-dependent DNA ligase
MTLPVPDDLVPMEARTVAAIPRGSGWLYEPKWDGFRCLAFRDGDNVLLRSKSGQPFERYFPEIVARLRALEAARFVLDGELVVPAGDSLSFDDLLQRIHPAASRVARLASEHPGALPGFRPARRRGRRGPPRAPAGATPGAARAFRRAAVGGR